MTRKSVIERDLREVRPVGDALERRTKAELRTVRMKPLPLVQPEDPRNVEWRARDGARDLRERHRFAETRGGELLHRLDQIGARVRGATTCRGLCAGVRRRHDACEELERRFFDEQRIESIAGRRAARAPRMQEDAPLQRRR